MTYPRNITYVRSRRALAGSSAFQRGPWEPWGSVRAYPQAASALRRGWRHGGSRGDSKGYSRSLEREWAHRRHTSVGFSLFFICGTGLGGSTPTAPTNAVSRVASCCGSLRAGSRPDGHEGRVGFWGGAAPLRGHLQTGSPPAARRRAALRRRSRRLGEDTTVTERCGEGLGFGAGLDYATAWIYFVPGFGLVLPFYSFMGFPVRREAGSSIESHVSGDRMGGCQPGESQGHGQASRTPGQTDASVLVYMARETAPAPWRCVRPQRQTSVSAAPSPMKVGGEGLGKRLEVAPCWQSAQTFLGS